MLKGVLLSGSEVLAVLLLDGEITALRDGERVVAQQHGGLLGLAGVDGGALLVTGGAVKNELEESGIRRKSELYWIVFPMKCVKVAGSVRERFMLAISS